MTVPSTSTRQRGTSRGRALVDQRRRPVGAAVAVMLVMLIALVVASIAIGSRAIAPDVVLEALLHPSASDDRHQTVLLLRVPRTIVVVLVGIALGAAGTLMQAMTRNPLAEPGLLGVNAGAAAAVVAGALIVGSVDTGWTFLFAFLGAAVAAVAVYALGGALGKGSNPVRLVLAGTALSAVLAAFTGGVLVNFPAIFDRFRFWDAGSFQGRAWEIVAPTAIAVAIGAVLALTLMRSLNALALGDEFGAALGVDTRRTWIVAGVAVVLLSGSATAAAGPIAFVGLVAPMVARAVVGPDYAKILPLSMLAAALVMLLADIGGRLVMLPSELEASIVCALLGAPVFIAIVRKRRVPKL